MISKFEKFYLSGAVALMLVVVLSCNQDVNVDVQNDHYRLIQDKVHQVYHDSDVHEAYHWLLFEASAQEQFEYWNYKLERTLEIYTWNLAQINSINELKSALELSWFEGDQGSFLTFEPKWRAQALRYFTYPDLYLIVAYPGPFLNENERDYSGARGDGNTLGGGLLHTTNCGCSKKSDYCGSLLGTGYDRACTGTCELTTRIGCGTLLIYECDGSCE